MCLWVGQRLWDCIFINSLINALVATCDEIIGTLRLHKSILLKKQIIALFVLFYKQLRVYYF